MEGWLGNLRANRGILNVSFRGLLGRGKTNRAHTHIHTHTAPATAPVHPGEEARLRGRQMPVGYHGNSSWWERQPEEAKSGFFLIVLNDQLSAKEREEVEVVGKRGQAGGTRGEGTTHL